MPSANPTAPELLWLAKYRKLIGGSDPAKDARPKDGDNNGESFTMAEATEKLWVAWGKERLDQGFLNVTGTTIFKPRRTIAVIDNALTEMMKAELTDRKEATAVVRTAARSWIKAKEGSASSRRPGVMCLLAVLDRIDAETLEKSLLGRPCQAPSEENDRSESESDESAGSGAMATVAKITYKNGYVVAFKKAETNGEMKGGDALNHGIPDTNAEANLAGRSVANSVLAEMLGLDNVPKTTYAQHGGSVGTAQAWADGAPNVTMEKRPAYSRTIGSNSFANCLVVFPYPPEGPEAPACSWEGDSDALDALSSGDVDLAEEYWNKDKLYLSQATAIAAKKQPDLREPALQKSLADAHLFDLLTGQLDRNPQNFVFDTNSTRVHLIDNDQSFAPSTRLGDDAKPARPKYLPGLPDLVDENTAKRFRELSEKDLTALLGAHGMTPAEQSCAVERLRTIKTHLESLEDGGHLVSTWDDDTFTQQSGKGNSYLWRVKDDLDFALSVERAKQGGR
jgi:hypothetical protein